MKMTAENNTEQFVLDDINTVYIGFDDNTEVKLDKIIEYDIDLDKIEHSFIELTNAETDTEIVNHFVGNKKNHVIYVDVKGKGFDIKNNKEIDVYYKIPCNMHMRKLRTHGECREEVGRMFIQLEGFIK